MATEHEAQQLAKLDKIIEILEGIAVEFVTFQQYYRETQSYSRSVVVQQPSHGRY